MKGTSKTILNTHYFSHLHNNFQFQNAFVFKRVKFIRTLFHLRNNNKQYTRSIKKHNKKLFKHISNQNFNENIFKFNRIRIEILAKTIENENLRYDRRFIKLFIVESRF